MLGKILDHVTYLLMLPYQSHWPRVHEYRYEIDPAEFGKQPMFFKRANHYWRGIEPLKIDRSRLTKVALIGGSEEAPIKVEREIPLRDILALENRWWQAVGNHLYHRKQMTDGTTITRLVVERDGEVLADYLACGGLGTLWGEDIRFIAPIGVDPLRASKRTDADPLPPDGTDLRLSFPGTAEEQFAAENALFAAHAPMPIAEMHAARRPEPVYMSAIGAMDAVQGFVLSRGDDATKLELATTARKAVHKVLAQLPVEDLQAWAAAAREALAACVASAKKTDLTTSWIEQITVHQDPLDPTRIIFTVPQPWWAGEFQQMVETTREQLQKQAADAIRETAFTAGERAALVGLKDGGAK